ncbi:unnamed protein product [Cunninghamella echinulata]
MTRVDQPMDTIVKTSLDRLKLEPTEEIRQLWLDALITLMKQQQQKVNLNPPMDDIWFGIIKLTVHDTCPDVVKKSANLLILLIEYHPKAISLRGEHTIHDCIIPLLSHKHTAIRVLGIKAFSRQLLCSSQGLSNLSELFIKLIHDHSPLVRTTFYSTMCDLMVSLSPIDRYNHANQLLPIFFSGIADELESICTLCQLGLEKLGRICSQDLIDAGIMDSIKENEKVDIGLKHIVHQSFDSCLKRLMGDSNDFIISKKVTALSALHQFLTYTTKEDMIRKNKWVIQRLMTIIASPTTSITSETDQLVKVQLDKVICVIGEKLSWPILLDQLLPRLEKQHLIHEASHLPASVAVASISDIFITLGKSPFYDQLDSDSLQKIKLTLTSAHLKSYFDTDTYSTLTQLYIK